MGMLDWEAMFVVCLETGLREEEVRGAGQNRSRQQV